MYLTPITTGPGWKHLVFIGTGKPLARKTAVIYSIFASCRSRSIDPYAYIKDVLTRLPTMTNHQIVEITLQAWKKANHGNVKTRSA